MLSARHQIGGTKLFAPPRTSKTPPEITRRHKRGFERLLHHGAETDLSIIRFDNQAAIHYAAGMEDDAEWLELLLQYGADPNQTRVYPAPFLFVPLEDAILSGQKRNVELLVAAGADINWQEPTSGGTHLIGAAYGRHYHLVYYLLEEGADYRARTTGGDELTELIVRLPTLDPASEQGRWREKVLAFLEQEGVDLESARQRAREFHERQRQR